MKLLILHQDGSAFNLLDIDSKYWMIAGRLLAGEETGDERAVFESWCATDERHEAWFASVEAAWQSAKTNEGHFCDVNEAWRLVCHRLGWDAPSESNGNTA
jgi:hypothetical protein